jgi:hypothetical protein
VELQKGNPRRAESLPAFWEKTFNALNPSAFTAKKVRQVIRLPATQHFRNTSRGADQIMSLQT